jgi:hypothetical protein
MNEAGVNTTYPQSHNTVSKNDNCFDVEIR